MGGYGWLIKVGCVVGVVGSKLRNNHGCSVSPVSGDGCVVGSLFPIMSVFFPYGVVGGGWVGMVG